MIFCLECKGKIRDGLQFCTLCGASLDKRGADKARLILLSNSNSQSEFNLNGGHCFLGRHSNNHIVLDDDRISKKHAEIWYDADGYWIKDLGSRNGVTVNGQVINSPCKLLNGNLIKLGFMILRFEQNQ